MSALITKTPGWLDWYENPSTPRFTLPAGAVDAHCHVFGPAAEFPFAPERKYTPCDASKDQLFALRDHLGISRNVIVQATCHGADNTAMVDAVQSAGGRARGIATVRPDVTDTELRRLDDAGVRGVRFNFVKRLVDASPTEDLATIAKKIAPLGWHVVIYFEAADLPDLQDFFTALPVPLVVDHMGRPDVTQPVDGPEFGRFLRFVDRGDVWVKVSCPERLSVTGPDGAGRRTTRLHRRRPLRPPGHRGIPRVGAVGNRLAAPQPQRPHARRRAAGRLPAADRRHRRSSSTTTRGQSDAPVLAR